MASHATITEYTPTSPSLVQNPAKGVIYLMPRAHGPEGKPAYFGADMFLQKKAADEKLAVEYALPEDEREFVEYFSATLTVVSIVVTVASLIGPTIRGIKGLIRIAASRKGYKPEEILNAEVNLKIEQLETANMVAKGLEISGAASAVEAALDALNTDR